MPITVTRGATEFAVPQNATTGMLRLEREGVGLLLQVVS